MPTLDENGLIPRAVMFGSGTTVPWEDAAVRCGVDPAEVAARKAAIEQLHDLAQGVARAVDHHLNQVGIVTDFCPWGEPDEIGPSGDRAVEAFAGFMVASWRCRTLIDRGRS
jgi:hypothetical protein